MTTWQDRAHRSRLPRPYDESSVDCFVSSESSLGSSATTVDYLSAMKRASAFVTEVGGLTCHAAVVAREFGVPCIVGLKNAMNTIKDGSRIEVFTEKGVVKRT